jgi:hypothetical protein
MKTKIFVRIIALLGLLSGIVTASPLGTAFTYHGRLTDGSSPANGSYDFRFAVYDAASGGTQQGATIAADALDVANGLFLTTLDFSTGVFSGDARWMEISVRPHGSGDFTTLTPRQPLTPTPYAIFANAAGNLSGTLPAAQLAGTVANNQLANNSITVSAGTGLSGGGTVALGGTTTLNNAGVLSVSGNDDITVTNLNGAVTLGDTATSANTASTTVKRDGSGNFSAGSVTLGGALKLPYPAIIYSGSDTVFIEQGSTFVGKAAGLGETGSHNVGVGDFVLSSSTSGSFNTAVGEWALRQNTSGNGNTANGQWALANNTTGSENTANGREALCHNTSGYENTAIGSGALSLNTSGYLNTANGVGALYWNTTGSENTANGFDALASNTTGTANTANGLYALYANTTGSANTADGFNALRNTTTGFANIALGWEAGYNITTGNANIDIGNQGVSTDTSIIRIGAGQTQTFVAGIYGATASSGALVFVNSSGQLGTVSDTPIVASSATDFAGTLNGDVTGKQKETVVAKVGGQMAADVASGVIAANAAIDANTAGTIVKRDGNGNFSAGTVTGNLSGNAATVTHGVYDNGAYANPAWVTSLAGSKITGNISGNAAGFDGSLAGDVTGSQSVTVVGKVGGQTAADVASGVIAANAATSASTTSTIVKRDASGNFSAGSVTLNGMLTLPTTTASAGIISLDGYRLLHAYGIGNMFVGYGAGNFTMTGGNNTAYGGNALCYNTSGSYNTANGFNSLCFNTSGMENTANGLWALYANTSGSENTANGTYALGKNTGGNNNIALGYQAGYNITTGDANIDIGNQGVSTDANIIRIGAGQTQTFVAGIYGATASSGTLVFVNSSGQLGTVSDTPIVASSATDFTGMLDGDVTGKQKETVVAKVGGQMAADVASGVIAANAAIDANTAGTIVKRDVSGNFSAGTITANLSGNAATVTHGVYDNGVYANPAWVTSLAGSKITGNISGNAAGFDGSLAGDVTGPQSVTVVGKVGGQTAADVASGVIAANAATSASTASTIVKRDASGDFSAGSVTLSGTLTLPATTASAGIINLGGTRVLHAYGSQSMFVGSGAGNFTMSGGDNTALGWSALSANTSGSQNTASGQGALANNTSGSHNMANGQAALYYNTEGSDNAASGYQALFSNTNGSHNTADGYQALFSNTSGYENTANGYYALISNTTGSQNTANGATALIANTTGWYNTASGNGALRLNTNGYENTASGYGASEFNASGSFNTAFGGHALRNNTSGSNNIALGDYAGYNITTGNYNIDIGNQGISTDANIIRIGAGQTQTFVAGIYGTTASSGAAVYVNSDGQLGTLTSSAKFKQDIQKMDDASEVLYALKPVTFRYKPELDPQAAPQFGLVAEDVDKVAPDLVVRDEQHGIYTVRYQAVDAMLLNEFLKQHRTVEEQKAEIETLKEKAARVDSLEQRLERLEQILSQKSGGGQ